MVFCRREVFLPPSLSLFLCLFACFLSFQASSMPPKQQQQPPSSAAFNERRLDIGNLPPRELVALRDQLEQESRNLAQRAMALQQVAAQFGGSGRAIERLAEQKKGERHFFCSVDPAIEFCFGQGCEEDSCAASGKKKRPRKQQQQQQHARKATMDVRVDDCPSILFLFRPSSMPNLSTSRPLLSPRSLSSTHKTQNTKHTHTPPQARPSWSP